MKITEDDLGMAGTAICPLSGIVCPGSERCEPAIETAHSINQRRKKAGNLAGDLMAECPVKSHLMIMWDATVRLEKLWAKGLPMQFINKATTDSKEGD